MVSAFAYANEPRVETHVGARTSADVAQTNADHAIGNVILAAPGTTLKALTASSERGLAGPLHAASRTGIQLAGAENLTSGWNASFWMRCGYKSDSRLVFRRPSLPGTTRLMDPGCASSALPADAIGGGSSNSAKVDYCVSLPIAARSNCRHALPDRRPSRAALVDKKRHASKVHYSSHSGGWHAGPLRGTVEVAIRMRPGRLYLSLLRAEALPPKDGKRRAGPADGTAAVPVRVIDWANAIGMKVRPTGFLLPLAARSLGQARLD